MERAESPADATIREVWEETGIDVEPERLIGVGFWPLRPRGRLHLIFRCRALGGTLTPSAESPEVGFFFPDALPRPMLNMHRTALPRWLDHGGGPAVWYEQPLSARMKVGLFVLRKLFYPLKNLRRRLAGDPYFPPPAWRIEARVVVRNGAGQVLWLGNGGGDPACSLPGGAAQVGETPWDAARRAVWTQAGLDVALDALSGISVASPGNRMRFIFTAQLNGRGPAESRTGVVYFTPGREQTGCDPVDLRSVADAVAAGRETVIV